MQKIAIAIHGGASPSYPYLRKNSKEFTEGLEDAINAGYKILQQGKSAVTAVETAVKCLENNPCFNAGRGASLNCLGEVELDAAIMNGANLKAGAVAIVKNVKNPIELARFIMQKTNHVLLAGQGALAFAKYLGVALEDVEYFITEHQQKIFQRCKKNENFQEIFTKKNYGTVGAVAVDKKGNIAAATSTGGTSNSLVGRIGDSCIIGAGCYANNQTCAMSGTGIGEYLIREVTGHTISTLVEQGMGLQEACDIVVHKKTALKGREIGVIAINAKAEIAIAFNTTIMKRAWMSSDSPLKIEIFN